MRQTASLPNAEDALDVAPSRIMVGMSGGVDSAVAALLLKRQGHDVSGLFMKNWQEQDPLHPCTAAEDARDARDVCRRLDMDFTGINFSAAYRQAVFRQFLEQYAMGLTPNPDILCNREIKFGAFLDHALAQGADFIATGHYARLARQGDRYRLLKGVDPDKDQSYFLHTLDQDQLSKAVFPLGHLKKSEVRRIAAQAGFSNHDKRDSTGICFIGERDFRAFLQYYLEKASGPICTLDGAVLGEHDGLVFYTIGQRRGLGIGGTRRSTGDPWYVAGKDPATNTLYVVPGHHHPALYATGLTATRIHWIEGSAPRPPYRCQAKTRYRQPAQDCEIVSLEGDECRVVFDTAQWAVTPGQAVVFYQSDACLGGATIQRADSPRA